MEPWATEIGNAYPAALTSGKVCIRAGPEFGDLEGHLLIIYKALYVSKLSGKAFGQLLQECLLDLSFVPSLAKASIYMRRCPTGDHFEYIATYIDDLAVIMKDPQSLINQLIVAPYQLKESGPLNFRLGCEFSCDSTGT